VSGAPPPGATSAAGDLVASLRHRLSALRARIGGTRRLTEQLQQTVDLAARIEAGLQQRIEELERRLREANELPASSLPVACFIDRLWCDRHGVYVAGWAHAYAHKVRRIEIAGGGARAAIDSFIDRPDVVRHYPDHPHVRASGFAVYFPAAPFRPLGLGVVTDAGTGWVPIAVPEHLRTPPTAEPAGGGDAPIQRFVAEMAASGGRVLEVGARHVTGSPGMAALLPNTCQVLGLDIHPGPGVDLVGDAHVLTQLVGRGGFDGVSSSAVLEHLAMPWVVAAEINRVLKPGGLTFHATHQAWPLHEAPNDFWRFSDEALKVLFSPALGFEVIAAGMNDPLRMYPAPPWRVPRYIEMPDIDGFGGSWILARKTADLPDAATVWPLDAARLRSRSEAYPYPKPQSQGVTP